VVCFLVAAISFALAIITAVDIDAGLIDDARHLYGFLCIFCNMLAILLFVAGEELWQSGSGKRGDMNANIDFLDSKEKQLIIQNLLSRR
jgi:hypothetical protein